MSHYLTDKNLTKVQLRRVIEIMASCNDMGEVYWETDKQKDRDLLRKVLKPKFLPKEDDAN